MNYSGVIKNFRIELTDKKGGKNEDFSHHSTCGGDGSPHHCCQDPIPGTGGYLNFGDIAVVFCGLFLGKKWGALAGGIGSALADIIGGFFIFAPVTLIAKGLEGFLAGTIGSLNHPVPLLLIAGLAMLGVYFFAELFLPGMGLAAALSEAPFNVIQAVVGTYGGYGVYRIVIKALPKKEN